MTGMYEEYKLLQKGIVKRRFEKKMEEVEESAFLADIPFEEHKSLLNSTLTGSPPVRNSAGSAQRAFFNLWIKEVWKNDLKTILQGLQF
eukprot:397977-Hanusia_phi.AAC.2